jgi:hypothetical protein
MVKEMEQHFGDALSKCRPGRLKFAGPRRVSDFSCCGGLTMVSSNEPELLETAES